MLLTELCANARIKLPELSQKLGMSRYLVNQQIKTLEKQLGLRYTIELNGDKLGLGTVHVMYLNFVKKPSPETLSGMHDAPHPSAMEEEIEAVTRSMNLKGGEVALVGMGDPDDLEDAFGEFISISPGRRGRSQTFQFN